MYVHHWDAAERRRRFGLLGSGYEAHDRARRSELERGRSASEHLSEAVPLQLTRVATRHSTYKPG